MHHATIDLLATAESPLHRRDPRAKLLSAVALVLATSLAPAPAGARLAALALVPLAAALLGRLPLAFLGRRLLVILPFVALPALLVALTAPAGDGWPRAGVTVGRAVLAAATTLVLAATTRMTDLLHALRWLRVPRTLVTVTGLLYRYLFVLVDEGERMQRARLARAGRRPRAWRGAAPLLATLLLRAHARAEAVYRAMLARGLSSAAPPAPARRLTAGDGLLVAVAVAMALAGALTPMPRWP